MRTLFLPQGVIVTVPSASNTLPATQLSQYGLLLQVSVQMFLLKEATFHACIGYGQPLPLPPS